jgi:hypothetical protein
MMLAAIEANRRKQRKRRQKTLCQSSCAVRLTGRRSIFEQGVYSLESQRDSAAKPRVARHELPWVNRGKSGENPNGVLARRTGVDVAQPRWGRRLIGL